MKMKTRYLSAITSAVLAVGFLVATALVARAGSHEPEARPRGREIVRIGTRSTLSGPLKQDRGEWFVVIGEHEYELHLGNHEYRRRIGLELEAGREAVVDGFVYGHDVAVIRLTVGDREYHFRKDDGTPLWAGLSEGEGSGKEGGGGGAGGGGGRRAGGEGEGEGRGRSQ